MFFRISSFLSAILALWIISADAKAGPIEEAFVQQQAFAGLEILQDKYIGETEKNVAFGKFIDSVIDSRKVARFVLGKYARGLDSAVFDDFKHAFDAYAKNIYQDNLTKFGGESLIVTGSIDRKPGDAIVNTIISGGALEKPLNVRWRVRTKDGISKIIDLEAFGIWLAVQQRSEITSYIANNGGKVKAATNMLQKRVAN
ncbi:MAG: ABC transporter substrate-binding protein [Robiginitomaculum sp.]|nr:ABC transporter substrate-binding protein [Robiginitomaculum sp.]